MADGIDGLEGLVSGGEFRLVLVTAPDSDIAGRLARELVEARLAACVNQLPGILSTYRWQGSVEEDSEVLLLIKTSRENLNSLAEFLDSNHPYDMPELISFGLTEVERAYAGWLRQSLDSKDPQG